VAQADLPVSYDPRCPDLRWSSSTRPASGFQELTIAESRSTANPEEADLLLKRLPSC
jgi:hypothetical protein